MTGFRRRGCWGLSDVILDVLEAGPRSERCRVSPQWPSPSSGCLPGDLFSVLAGTMGPLRPPSSHRLASCSFDAAEGGIHGPTSCFRAAAAVLRFRLLGSALQLGHKLMHLSSRSEASKECRPSWHQARVQRIFWL
ncbi:unnamed protein product [Lepidochelys olivacea]